MTAIRQLFRRSILFLTVLAAGVVPAVQRVIWKLLDVFRRTDEKRFLKTLRGVPRQIWARRIKVGLTQSELDFVRKRMGR